MASMPILFHCNSLLTNTEPENEKDPSLKPPTLLIQTAPQSTPQTLELTVNVQNDIAGNRRNSSDSIGSNTKEDLSQDTLNQLNNHVLPPFRASLPISPWLKVVVPPGGFKCNDCGDTFLLESSLKQHLERRSVYIQFPCDVCNVSLVYYNRCSLLAHLRNHRANGERVDISKANIGPLTKELLIGNMVSPVVQPGSNGASTCSILLSHLSRETANENHAANTGYTKGGKYRCPECFQLFDTLSNKEDHFGNKISNPNASTQCPKCSMVCPSKCSLQAHQRIHMRIHPYVCPECGDQHLGSWEKFMTHLNQKCFHFSRHVTYNCFICESLHMSSMNLQNHILKSHTNVYFKCQACPMAFKTPSTFDHHKRTVHKFGDAHCKTIFKCPLCETVFHIRDKLLEHLTVHIKEQLINTKYIFRCSECLAAFNSKILLSTHTETLHPRPRDPNESFEASLGLKTPLPASNNVTTAQLLKLDEPINANNKEEPINCVICDRMFQNKKSYNTHYKHIHSNENAPPSFTCNVCKAGFKENKLLTCHEEVHLKEGKFVCLLCHQTGFSSEDEFKSHLKKQIEDLTFPSNCVTCNDPLENFDSAVKHIGNKHSVDLQPPPVIPPETTVPVVENGVDPGTEGAPTEDEGVTETPQRRKHNCHVCGKSFPKKSHLRRHLNRVHRTLESIKKMVTVVSSGTLSVPENESDETNLPPIKIRIPLQLVKQEPPDYVETPETLPDSNSNSPTMPQNHTRNFPIIPAKKLRLFSANDSLEDYICAKCDFTCAKESEFKEHIMMHKRDSNSLQCPECGTCFVVETSLRKHLVVSHRIPNVEDYLKEAKDNAQGLTKDIICNSTTNTWQCRVCCKSFDDEANLKFHMRSHGMAFIRSRPKPPPPIQSS